MTEGQQKNRRYRNAKISQNKLRKVVIGFAKTYTAAQTAGASKLSVQAVDLIYARLRERIAEFGFVNRSNLTVEPGTPPMELGAHVARYRGVPEEQRPLYEFEVINRIMAEQHIRKFRKLKASDMKAVEEARKLKADPRGHITVFEVTKARPGEKSVTREFELSNYRTDSDILINERYLDKHEAFFTFLWRMLLLHPL